MYEDLVSKAMKASEALEVPEASESEILETEVFEPLEVYRLPRRGGSWAVTGLVIIYPQTLSQSWIQPERKIFWSSRNHQVKLRQRRLESVFSDKDMGWLEQTWRNLCWNWRWRSWVVMRWSNRSILNNLLDLSEILWRRELRAIQEIVW